MRVLVLGAAGFIGSETVARLAEAGHIVVGVARPGRADPSVPCNEWVELDVARATEASHWKPHLAGIDAVVNCAGVFQDSPRESTGGVHASGPAALFEACAATSVRRVVHLSAVGVDREAPSPFSRSKAAGDARLMSLDLDWVILRPSVVLGRNAAGSGALFRGLAALPLLPVLPGTGALQVVRLDDLTRTILALLEPDAPAKVALEVVGPERLQMSEIVQRYRQWLGWRRAPEFRPPAWLMPPVYWLGDLAGLLGWPSPIRSNARLEMKRGATGDPSAWTRAAGIRPVSLDAALAREPASVQERLFARLYFLKPVVLATLALFWIGTGVVSLGPGWEQGLNLLEGTAFTAVAPLSVAAGALADMAIGVGIAVRRTSRLALYGSLAVSIFYGLAGTAVHPELWSDPLGPMLKIWPIMVLSLVALAVVERR